MTLLYETIAGSLLTSIEQGVYRQGERLPAVRKISEQHKVSIATVITALHKLEDRGVIEARQRSGYYVCCRAYSTRPEPTTSSPDVRPTSVTDQTLVLNLSKASNDPTIIQLGAAVPAALYLPVALLERSMSTCSRQYRNRGAAYEFPPGSIELRRQIARRMTENGCPVNPANIVITSGCQEAVMLALRAVTQPGDIVAIESPTFYGLLQVIESLGLQAIEIPTHPRHGISLQALQLACEQWPVRVCLVVPNFSNPLGYCMSDTHKQELVALADRYDFALIEDDIYGDLGFGLQRPSVAKAWDSSGRVLHCASFSKSLSCGLRVGWIVPGRYFETVEYLKYVTNLAAPTVPQLAVAELLEKGGFERYLRQVRGQYAQAVERMTRAIDMHFPDSTRVTQPAGGFVLWVELPESVDAVELARQALVVGISIAPGPIFSATQKYRNFIRLNCACEWNSNTERALLKLGRLIAAS
jgi:DNA-binding transcriptional MocR family regulator